MLDEEDLDFSKLHINPNDVSQAIKAFKWFHNKRTGLMRREEISKALECLGLRLHPADIAKMIEEIDNQLEDKTRQVAEVTLKEFLQITLKRIHQMNMQDDLLALFHLYDLDGVGKLSREEVQFLSLKLLEDLRLGTDLVNRMIMESPKDQNGLIDYKAFIRLLVQDI